MSANGEWKGFVQYRKIDGEIIIGLCRGQHSAWTSLLASTVSKILGKNDRMIVVFCPARVFQKCNWFGFTYLNDVNKIK